MWHPIALPKYPTPIRACSVPINGEAIAIWTDRGVYRIRLNKSPAIFLMYPCEKMEGKFDLKKGQFLSHGNMFVMTGDCGRHGIRTDPGLKSEHRHGDRIEINQQAKRVTIVNTVGDVILSVPDVDPTDDFFVASFAHSSNANWNWGSPYLIVCDSRQLRAYRYEEDPQGAVPKWKPYGSKETKESLMREIIANPDNNTPRLIFADWLEEHGDTDRAEFIRLQCRIVEREQSEFVSPLDPDYSVMSGLESQHSERWETEFPAVKGVHYTTPFWRGFPRLSLSSPSLLTLQKNSQKLQESVPIESVTLSFFKGADAQKIAKWPASRNWRKVTIHNSWHANFPFYEPILNLPSLERLRCIEFRGWFGDALIASLLKNTTLKQLITVEFHCVENLETRNGINMLANRKSTELVSLKSVIITSQRSSTFRTGKSVLVEELNKHAKSFENAIHIEFEGSIPCSVTRF